MAKEIKKHHKSFDSQSFLKDATKSLAKLEMKERVVQISDSLHPHLPGPYSKNIKILIKTLKNSKNIGLEGFILWPYSHYIETYGLEDFETSMGALYELTKRFTSEWGIRLFFENEPAKVYKILNTWSKDKNEHVRRLVSEGTRPNLPWGRNISHLKKNKYKKNINLLEKLKFDPSEYVRKSVANHLNDISWHEPDLVIGTLKKWNQSKNEHIDWITKRALRNLLKQGHPKALSLIGYNSKLKTTVADLKVSKKTIQEGDSFELKFSVKNNSSSHGKFMVDYIIYYPKANGSLSPKTFKLKNIELAPKKQQLIEKKINFKKVTTRKHYKGVHQLHIQVNGVVKSKTKFKLL